jgi:cytoplasmic iron level regulating protein YaaA (DUF328/UPF0246 family)
MLTILLHSSKTMREAPTSPVPYQAPTLLGQARTLASYLKTLDVSQLEKHMRLSNKKAAEIKELLALWSDEREQQRPAIDAFLGDMYSGLQVQSFSKDDRSYANEHLLILSGLYGGLRALDGIHPYRLEMGYKLPDNRYANLYEFWGDSIAKLIPSGSDIVNISAVEYTKAVLPHLPDARVITPKFMTISPKTGEPTFVTVHAKVARGAFARWLIQNRIESVERLKDFTDLNYRYDKSRSTDEEPVFVCQEFGGIGLSVRLT